MVAMDADGFADYQGSSHDWVNDDGMSFLGVAQRVIWQPDMPVWPVQLPDNLVLYPANTHI